MQCILQNVETVTHNREKRAKPSRGAGGRAMVARQQDQVGLPVVFGGRRRQRARARSPPTACVACTAEWLPEKLPRLPGPRRCHGTKPFHTTLGWHSPPAQVTTKIHPSR